jgi:hypothetical protein
MEGALILAASQSCFLIPKTTDFSGTAGKI